MCWQTRGLIAIVFTASLYACPADEQSSPICGPSSCGGCCLNGVCQTSAPYCGLNGGACALCAAGQTCVNGVCEGTVSDCGRTCPGCCSGDTCLDGTAASACGAAGSMCVDCGLSGQSCNTATRQCEGGSTACGPAICGGCCSALGRCEPGTIESECGRGGEACQGCPASQICSNGACVPLATADSGVVDGPPPSGPFYDVVVGRLVISNALVACGELECDPFVLMTVTMNGGALSWVTTTKAGNDVVFDEVVLPRVPASALLASLAVHVDVKDDDGGLSPALICSEFLYITQSDLSLGRLTQACGAHATLTVLFRQVP